MSSASVHVKPWIIIAALLGAIAVLAGAFGAHGLKEILTPAQLVTWKMASFYQLVHAVLLMAMAFSVLMESRWFRLAGKALLFGIVLFSGSLYHFFINGNKISELANPSGRRVVGRGVVDVGFCGGAHKNFIVLTG